MLFETGNSPERFPETLMRDLENRNALPPTQSVPASAYAPPAGSWRDTNDRQKVPESVTDSTTKLLQKEESDQSPIAIPSDLESIAPNRTPFESIMIPVADAIVPGFSANV